MEAWWLLVIVPALVPTSALGVWAVWRLLLRYYIEPDVEL